MVQVNIVYRSVEWLEIINCYKKVIVKKDTRQRTIIPSEHRSVVVLRLGQ